MAEEVVAFFFFDLSHRSITSQLTFFTNSERGFSSLFFWNAAKLREE